MYLRVLKYVSKVHKVNIQVYLSTFVRYNIFRTSQVYW